METEKVKDIPCLSIDKVLQVFKPGEDDAYSPGCFIGTRVVNGIKEQTSLPHPFSLDAFVFFLCEEGSVDIVTNLSNYHVVAGELFINFPGQIMEVESVDNCRVRIVALDLDLVRKMNMDIKPFAQKLLDLKAMHNFAIPATAMAEMYGISDALSEEIRNNKPDDASAEILRNLYMAFLFKIVRAIDRIVTVQSVDKQTFNKNAGYFKDFLLLLNQHFKEERSVGFYAERMHLSPKYFTTLIKKTSGQTAAEWINSYVIIEAKNLLKYSTMNVQEIAYHLNFPNQSFFGKYFKHHTGMTPSMYKKSQ